MYEKEEVSESEMSREISNLIRPRSLVILLIGSVLVFLAFSSSSQLVINTSSFIFLLELHFNLFMKRNGFVGFVLRFGYR